MVRYKNCKHNPYMPFGGKVPMIRKRKEDTTTLKCPDCKSEFHTGDYKEYYPELVDEMLCPYSITDKNCEGIMKHTYFYIYVCPECEDEEINNGDE